MSAQKFSLASSSEEEEEEEYNDEDHDQLIQAISSLENTLTTELQDEPDTSQRKSIDTTELLEGIKNKKGLKQLKQRLSKLPDQLLLKPLAPVHKDRIHRKLAYERSSKQVSDWDPVVKHNKRAEHLQFPLQEDLPSLPSLTTKIDSFKAVTPLEVAVQALLSKSDHVIQDGEELSKAEKRALLKLSIQEATERRAELSKMRSLLSAYEQKQRRVNRIKSKKFHKVQRKIKEKIEGKKMVSEGEKNDLLEKAERLRAQERATLKHTRMSKWAKNQLSKKHRDEATMFSLTEQSRLKIDIKRKAYQESESDDGESVHDKEQMENVPIDPNNVWLTDTTRLTKGDLGDLSQESVTMETQSAKEDIDSDNDTPNKEQSRYEEKKSFKNKEQVKPVKSSIDPTDFFTTETLSNNLIDADRNELAVKEAFADDDVIMEFLKDKQEDVEGNKLKMVDLTLPGWGEWAGQGVVVKKRKRKRQLKEEEKTESLPRKDDKLKYVIINNGTDKKAAKHFVSHLPYPYKDHRVFARKMATPIGRHWNTETHFNEMIKPRIKTKIGTVIDPMKLTDDVEQFIKKTRNDKRKRRHL